MVAVIEQYFSELPIVTLIIVAIWALNKRSNTILQNWANANEFKIIKMKRSYFGFSGPFNWWTTSRNQAIYSFVVIDRDGRQRSGWARCGSWWTGGLFSDQIEIRWN